MNKTRTGLPAPTRDLRQACDDLDHQGCCLLSAALAPEGIAALRERLVAQAAGEARLGDAFEDGGPRQQWGAFQDASGRVRRDAFRAENGGVNQRVWMLVNKGEVFVRLLEHQAMLSLVSHVLGEHFLLSSFTANIARPGSVAMELHTDQWWMPPPALRGRRGLSVGSMTRTRLERDPELPGEAIAPVACVNVLWMLDDFTERNGATRVVPGSHLSGRHPDPDADPGVATFGATAPAGTALVLDGRTWHGTGANVGPGHRHAVLITFCGPQFRAQENFVAGTRPEVIEGASPALLALLGFGVWCGYGRTHHPTQAFIDRAAPALGVLGDEAQR